jgi:catechol 2,3-dioxygenase-like lactoylglutathione lyase family enzyme
MLLLGLLIVSCGGEDMSPEGRIRAGVDSAVEAAKDRDVLGVRSFISESYRDDRNQGKDALGLLLSTHLKRPTFLHIFHRMKSLSVDPTGTAEAVIMVAFGAREIPGPESLVEVNADIYRLELTLADEEGIWRVTAASWSPGEASDFLWVWTDWRKKIVSTPRFQAIIPVLPTPNLSGSIDFYVKKLGFKDVTPPQKGYAVLVRDDLAIHLQEWEQAEFEACTTPQFRIRVDDLDAVYQEFKSQDAFSHPVEIQEKTPWGTREFGFFDPSRVAIFVYQNLAWRIRMSFDRDRMPELVV